MDFQHYDDPSVSTLSAEPFDFTEFEPQRRRRTKTDFADESTLVEALRAGNESAFEYLVSTQRERMQAVARRFFAEEEDVRDAVQEAFLAAYRGIDRFEGQARLSTWLHRVVVNACLMKLRSRRRKPEQSLDEGTAAGLVSLDPEDAQSRLERREDAAEVQDAISTLPEHHRRVLLLRDIEDRDTRETAEVLSISPAAVKTRLHRARVALRSRLVRVDDNWRSAPVSQSA
jgi:RNA polymerase sigma-70 factor (ECF subfamily)